MAEPEKCTITVRLTIPISLAHEIEQESHRSGFDIPTMLSQMLIDAYEANMTDAMAQAALDRVVIEPGSFCIPSNGDGHDDAATTTTTPPPPR